MPCTTADNARQCGLKVFGVRVKVKAKYGVSGDVLHISSSEAATESLKGGASPARRLDALSEDDDPIGDVVISASQGAH